MNARLFCWSFLRHHLATALHRSCTAALDYGLRFGVLGGSRETSCYLGARSDLFRRSCRHAVLSLVLPWLSSLVHDLWQSKEDSA